MVDPEQEVDNFDSTSFYRNLERCPIRRIGTACKTDWLFGLCYSSRVVFIYRPKGSLKIANELG